MTALLEAVAFLLELAALVAYGLWGRHVGGLAAGIVLPLAVALLWGYALSPRARLRLAPVPKLGLRVGVLLLAAAALAAAGHVAWGLGLGLAVVADNVLLAVL